MGLQPEIETLRDVDAVRMQLQLDPVSLRLRTYAKEASSKCAADREIGAGHITVVDKPPWPQRFWAWLKGIF